MKRSLWLAALTITLAAQAQQKVPMYGSRDNLLLCDQAKQTLLIADTLLDKYPPLPGAEPIERQSALELIDNVLHDTRNDYSQAILPFAHSRMAKVLKNLNEPLDDMAMRVYKLYNAGALARTNNATVAFDLVRGRAYPTDAPLIADSLMQMLVDKADILFLSHNHGDHVDPVVVEMFLAQGKPVVAPAEVLPNHPRVAHIEPTFYYDRIDFGPGKSIYVDILPGHQDDMQNNITIVTFANNLSVAHTGDQWNRDDVPLLPALATQAHPIDVLLLNCWVNAFDQTLEALAPGVVITFHENELGHTIGHREPYFLSRELLAMPRPESIANIPSPLLTWGEWITLNLNE